MQGARGLTPCLWLPSQLQLQFVKNQFPMLRTLLKIFSLHCPLIPAESPEVESPFWFGGDETNTWKSWVPFSSLWVADLGLQLLRLHELSPHPLHCLIYKSSMVAQQESACCVSVSKDQSLDP